MAQTNVPITQMSDLSKFATRYFRHGYRMIEVIMPYLLSAAIWMMFLLLPYNISYAKWDSKSPIWVLSTSPRIVFRVYDKMSMSDQYKIRYKVSVLTDKKNDRNVILICDRTYTDNPETSRAVFPDDFVLEDSPNAKPGDYYPFEHPLYWEIFVNGQLIESGTQKTTVLKYEHNGTLINIKNR